MPEIINPILKAKIDPITGQPVIQQNQPIQAGNLQGTPAQPVSTLNISTGNPALKTLFDSANQLLNTYTSQGRTLTPEIQQRIQNINQTELQKQASVAGARTAADNKDAPALDTHITNANTAGTTQQADIQGLLSELKTARESYIGSLAPTTAETDLQTKLNTLRTDRQLLPIELRQEGISAPGIAGRQIEDERVRAIQEQNLLLELGLKQQARQYATTVKEKQVGFITDDINLQNKIQQQLQEQENKVLEEARNLKKDSLSAFSDIVDSMKGLAFTDLDPQSQSDILETAKQFSIPPQLLADAMQSAKQQQIFDNAIKAKKDTSITEAGGRKVLVDNQTGAIIKDLGAATAGGGTKEIYTEKDLPSNVRQSIIDTLTDKEGAKSLGRELTMTDMIKLFPEVNRETLQSYLDEFYDYETLTAGEKSSKPWWKFW